MSQARAPASEWVLRLDVHCAPAQELGAVPAGRRSNYPILGGRFEGLQGLRGEVLPGADFFLMRSDGIGVLDAHYSLRSDAGEVFNVHNRGVLWMPPGPAGAGADAPYRCHCTPQFELAEGSPHAWLMRSVLAGRVLYPAEGQVLIDVYRLR